MDTIKQYQACTGLQFGYAIPRQSLAHVTHMLNLAADACAPSTVFARVLLSNLARAWTEDIHQLNSCVFLFPAFGTIRWRCSSNILQQKLPESFVWVAKLPLDMVFFANDFVQDFQSKPWVLNQGFKISCESMATFLNRCGYLFKQMPSWGSSFPWYPCMVYLPTCYICYKFHLSYNQM